MQSRGRKIYFDKITGERILELGEGIGLVSTTVDQDIATFTALSERNQDTFDVLELEFGQYAQDFAECNGYRVTPTTKTLEFSYPDPNAPQEPPVLQKPLTEQILELKEKQITTNRLVSESGTSQQELLELLIDMGVI